MDPTGKDRFSPVLMILRMRKRGKDSSILISAFCFRPPFSGSAFPPTGRPSSTLMDPNKPRPRVMSSLSIPRPRAKTPVTSSIPKPTSTPSTPLKPKPKPAVRPTLTTKPSNSRLAPSPNKSRAPSPQKERKEEPDLPKPTLSLKEVIAQKRAEARKLRPASPTLGELSAPGDDTDLVMRTKSQEEDIDDLGRWSLRETIERARNTGLSIDGLFGLAVNDLKSMP